eukprot:233773-Amphidinium_carterae.1
MMAHGSWKCDDFREVTAKGRGRSQLLMPPCAGLEQVVRLSSPTVQLNVVVAVVVSTFKMHNNLE